VRLDPNVDVSWTREGKEEGEGDEGRKEGKVGAERVKSGR